ncbi:odorant receptor 131-2-like, partial [Electrophorus electricus]|uniref:odorant receptor 131-2-like n=1 Tax=Electrophorus electricus TaxID=8005 RepID=UPI0015D055E3
MNNSTTQYVDVTARQKVQVIIVQFLLSIFLYIDTLLIVTFFQKEYFRTSMRYVFFVHTLICDWIYLFISNILLILTYFSMPMFAWICIILLILMSLLTFSTPLTMVAMSLERYIAICLPLRHAEISTSRRTIYCILFIHGLSSIQIFVVLSIFFASVSHSFYMMYKVCMVEMLIVLKWQSYVRSAISLFYFLIMSCTILFTYVKIVTAAKMAASGHKKSITKGRNTVLLHGMQLFLGLFQFWTPFVEPAVLSINVELYVFVRYFDYVAFILAPRCLCPLVYGLRDKKFFSAVKYYVFCGLR